MDLQTQVLSASPRTSAAVTPLDPQWRERAESAFDADQPIAQALHCTPTAGWVGLLLIAVLVLGALLLSIFGGVEVSARGPGALRTAQGTVSVFAEATGPVTRVAVRSGERVVAGQALLAVDATALRASLEESERRLQFADNQAASANARLDTLAQQRRALLEQRAQLLTKRIANQDQSLRRHSNRVRDFDALRAQGFVSAHAREDAADHVDEAQRQSLGLAEELARVRAEMNELLAQRENEKLRLGEERANAQARRDAAQSVLRQGIALAPTSGVVESIVARVGEAVQPGALIARIVPDGAPDQVVAFVSERDRAFLVPGSAVRIDVRQLPAGEFGVLKGNITRIGADLASAQELRDVLGDGASAAAGTNGNYRVDIALVDDAKAQAMHTYLRAGMQADVRFTLRARRVITLVLEPLKKWLQG